MSKEAMVVVDEVKGGGKHEWSARGFKRCQEDFRNLDMGIFVWTQCKGLAVCDKSTALRCARHCPCDYHAAKRSIVPFKLEMRKREAVWNAPQSELDGWQKSIDRLQALVDRQRAVYTAIEKRIKAERRKP